MASSASAYLARASRTADLPAGASGSAPSNGSTLPSSTAAATAAAGSSMPNLATERTITSAGTAVCPSRAARVSR